VFGLTLLPSLTSWEWGVAAAVPVGIVLLYFLKLKRQPVEVPSTFLWKKSIEDLRVNSLWQRLRQSLLLFLQLLVVGLLLGALLRPAWNAEQPGERIILLMDQSASMGTSEQGGTRLKFAQEQARRIIEQMKPGDVGMVIGFDRTARVLASYTEDRQELLRGVDGMDVTQRSTDVREALSIASALANPQRILEQKGDAEVVPLELSAAAGQEATIYLLSDGVFPSANDFSLGNLKVEYIKIGQETENVGIMSMAARSRYEDREGTEVFARVRNFSASPKSVQMELRLNGERRDLRRIEIPALAEQGISFAAMNKELGGLSLKLSPGDAFALDDEAWLVTTPPRTVRVLRVGPANPVLDAVLSTPAFRRVASVESLPTTEEEIDLPVSMEEGSYDVIIFDRCRPVRMPSCNTWFIGSLPRPTSAPDGKAVEGARLVKGPVILTWDSTHPVLRFLQMDDVSIIEATTVPSKAGRSALIETDQGLMMWMESRGVFSDLVLSVSLLNNQGEWQTDWPLKPSFPVMVMNVLRFLGGVDADRGRNVRVGEPLVVLSDAVEGTVQLPGGKSQRVAARGGRIDFAETDHVGLYTLRVGGEPELAAVNFFDERESAIAPVEKITVGAESTRTMPGRFQVQRELWRWLTLAGLGFVLFEWYIYNKRVYV
jgi:uncharacterized LabA/DUF88 family protein